MFFTILFSLYTSIYYLFCGELFGLTELLETIDEQEIDNLLNEQSDSEIEF